MAVHGGIRVGYLPQVPELDENSTVLEQVLSGSAAAGVKAEEYEARQILNRLGLTEFYERIGALSGGQRKRVALAGVLITRCEALILDEPTNHLDDGMIRWLEGFLRQYDGALVMVTHDRYFLERIVSKIAEVDRGSLYLYEANYSRYLELRAQREEVEAGSERKRQSLLRRELAWMRQGPKARGTKSRSRIERFEELESRQAPAAQAKLELQSVATRLGRKTIELQAVSKRYGDKVLLEDFSQMIPRDARIGIVGPNGCGKTTLLKLIAGRLAPDSGQVVAGETVQIGYFAQECGDMDPAMRVIDYAKQNGDSVPTENGAITAAQMLERFLFPSDLQWNTISRLSGGERRRLYLLGILLTAPNILLLDEPTNDLDIDTLMVLEEYIAGFPGAVVLISHDRYFLDKTTDHILEFRGGGEIRKFLGGYYDYLNGIQAEAAPAPAKPEQPKEAAARRRSSPAPAKPRFTFKEQREYDEIDAVIAALEKEKQAVELAIQQAASNYEELERLLARKGEVELQLAERTERWFYLNELAERIEKG